MATITQPSIPPELLLELQESIKEEKQVIVHCTFRNDFLNGNLIRIWPTTFLLDKNSAHKSTLLFCNKISLHPIWTEVPCVKDYHFLLIFSGLPTNCKQFDLKEIIPESNGFLVQNITRNSTDVYHVTLE